MGAAGKDTRGVLRIHQFDKVEMVKFTKPEDSYDELESLVNDAESILQILGLHYRNIDLCAGDLGAKGAKCYDVELWSPGVGRYLEISSCTNFEAYQARRANIRFRRAQGDKPEFVHILNGSGLACPRLFSAILETFQQSDGSILVPEALRGSVGANIIVEPTVLKALRAGIPGSALRWYFGIMVLRTSGGFDLFGRNAVTPAKRNTRSEATEY